MDELRVIGVVQRMNFESGALEYYASVLLLGNARDVRITEEEFGALVDARMGKAGDDLPEEVSEKALEPTPRSALYEGPSEEHLAESSATTLDWTKIPEEVLSERHRRALTLLNIPPLVQAEQLQELLSKLEAEFTDEDWEVVRRSGQQPLEEAGSSPAPSAPPASIAAQGVVTWSDGVPILPQARAARTVPKDDWGYPVVTGSGVDPSTAVGSSENTDEDGIGEF